MKTTPISLMIAGLLFPTLCRAEPGKDKPGPPNDVKGLRHGPLRPAIERWKMADTDHDGFISKAEFDAMPRIQNLPDEKRADLFTRLDKDGDSKLSREELGSIGKDREGPDGHRMQRLWELDTDKSGGISFEEFQLGEFFKKLSPEKQQAVFKRLDTNGDGVISPSDRPEPPFKHPDGNRGPNGKDGRNSDGDGPPDGPGRINKKLDTNGDGALSFEEFRLGQAVKNLTEDQQEDRFELLDRNHDQKISPEDFPPPSPKPDGPPPQEN